MKEGCVRDIVGQARTENIGGMKPEDVRQAVLQKLQLGKYYKLQSVSLDESVNMKLILMTSNMAAFEAENGQTECFKYIELYKQFFGDEEECEE